MVIYYYYLFNCEYILTGDSGTTLRQHTPSITKIRRHAQTEHSTPNYTNINGQYIHSEYST
jgi:hypothetical protein